MSLKGQLLIYYSTKVFKFMYNLNNVIINNQRRDDHRILPKIYNHIFSFKCINVQKGQFTSIDKIWQYRTTINIHTI